MPKTKPPKLYKVWSAMKDRCSNPHNHKFPNYGAKGIRVCDEWLHNYSAFKEWSYANGYQEGLSIDRIDNSKGYCPENCRWVNMIVQQNNRTNNIRIEIDGVTHTLSEWSKISGIKTDTIYRRIKNGFPVKEAVFKPLIGYPRERRIYGNSQRNQELNNQ